MNIRYLMTAVLIGAVTATVGLKAQDDEGEFRRLLEQEEFSKVGVGTGTFLQIPVGARGTSLGSGFAGVADDASALYWNPAGITQVEGMSVNASYQAMFAGITHNFAGISFPISSSYTLGVSATTLSSGDIPVTDLFNQDGTGGFYSATDLAFGVSFAGQLTDQFSYGVTGKIVNMSIADVSASGVAFDFGTMYDPGFLGLNFGFVIQNLSAPLKYSGPGLLQKGSTDQVTGNRDPDVELESNSVSLPLIFRAGLGVDILEDNEDHALKANTEFSTTSNAPEHLGIGVEYVWKKLLAARVGYQLGSSDAYGLSAGLGLTYESGSFNAGIDYAIRPHQTLGLLNTITASVRLR